MVETVVVAGPPSRVLSSVPGLALPSYHRQNNSFEENRKLRGTTCALYPTLVTSANPHLARCVRNPPRVD